ncbi:MAG: hypothetical protein D3910_21440, partial [Candidatus Electrothrix sp. ATG2]|nr:hypothetical protein [Candidatus Electrothrix sp. ATG2]
ICKLQSVDQLRVNDRERDNKGRTHNDSAADRKRDEPGKERDYSGRLLELCGHCVQSGRIYQGGQKEEEQYADKKLIRPGDWLFYINHAYREIRHSALFIEWINYEKQTGLMLSYGGEGRGEAARYRAYDLSHVYTIIRPSAE